MLWGYTARTQDSADRELMLTIGYYMPANKLPYLKIITQEKVGRKFVPQKDIIVNIFAGEESDAGLLEKINTDQKGEGTVFIPASFKSNWDQATSFTFIAVTEATKIFPSTKSEIFITKAKMEIDTSSDGESKSITVKVLTLQNNEWQPARDVELKIAVKRSLENLPISDEQSYTTDSTGTVIAEFKRDSLLGDEKGNFLLEARTEDNESYGNLFAEKMVNWGVAPIIDNSFNHRSLWATRSKTPVWLLFMAYSIIAGVWGAMIYLISQFFKIRKIGRNIPLTPNLKPLPDNQE